MAFPDVVALYIAYLDGLLPVTVASRVPQPRPDQFVQVRRVGGLAVTPVRDRARLDVFSWAPSEQQAMATALDVRAATWQLSGTTDLGVVVYHVAEFMGPRQFDDSTADPTAAAGNIGAAPRAWATYELTVRADDVIEPSPSIGA